MIVLDPSLILAARIAATSIFIIGAIRHMRDFGAFVSAVTAYELLPSQVSTITAIAVIICESLIAVSLTTGLFIAEGVGLGVALLTIFAIAIGINLARGRTDIDCGCGDPSARQPLSSALILRNAIVAAIVLATLGEISVHTAPIQVVDGIAAGIVGVLFYELAAILMTNADVNRRFKKRFK